MFSRRMVGRTLVILVVVLIVTLGVMIFITQHQTNQIINQLSLDRTIAAKQGFVNYLGELSERAMTRGVLIAQHEALINAIKEYDANDHELTDENYDTIKKILDDFLFGYDFLSVTDSEGTALARTDSGERDYPLPKNGYNLMTNPDVQKVFETGEGVAALTFMIDNTTLVATTLYPIYDGETLLGIVTCLFDLTNAKYVDTYKERTGCEVAIFLGNMRFVTTLTDEDGLRAIGTYADDDVTDAIFEKNSDEYMGIGKLYGNYYGVHYTPLIYHGNIIGMISTAVNVDEAMANRNYLNLLIIITALCGGIISVVLVIASRKSSKVIDKQFQWQGLMNEISQEFLFGGDSDEELSSLITKTIRTIGRWMDIAQIRLYIRKADDERIYCCSNEWVNPKYDRLTDPGNEVIVTDALNDIILRFQGKEKFYICSDDGEIHDIMAPHRINFTNYLCAGIYVDGKIHAVLDFARENNSGKWGKNHIGVAAYLTNTLTGAFQRHAAKTQLISAKEYAEETNRHKSTFLANMSHEIRTPMNAILGIAEISLNNENLDTDAKEAMMKIYESGDLLLGIINDILDLSKIEAGKMELRLIKYNVPSLINDVAQLNILKYDKSIEFIVDIDAKTPLNLYGDEIRVKQVLNNVVSNAFKYTGEGTIEFKVYSEPVQGAENDCMMVFRVKDTGQGLSEEQLDRLYEEYTRFNLDINRTTIGAGLGLSITKKMLDLMNGEIFVQSKIGEGTEFTIYIPQKREDMEVCGAKVAENIRSFKYQRNSIKERTQIARMRMPDKRVLIVDDVRSNVYVTRGMLKPYGLIIDTAYTGYDAIEMVKETGGYDIIFMDHLMPKMDGIEATAILRDMGYKGKIVALTANVLVGQSEKLLASGFDAFLAKPLDSRMLDQLIKEFLRGK
ncbi:MAG: ATP-binding protein [Oscillospiraceae bacterium]|nr:ATP-binding protein [Oscillospiraceae bacterium]